MVIETVETFRLLAAFEAVGKFVVGMLGVGVVGVVLVVEVVEVFGMVAEDMVVVEDVVGTVIQ